MKGYYSVMQYCPDRSRAEAANVGVVLFTDQSGIVGVRTSPTLSRVKRFFKPDDLKLAQIRDAVRANETRLCQSTATLRTLDDLNHFARTMGNDIRLTAPLVTRVEDIDRDLAKLFGELVEDSVPTSTRRAVLLPTVINQVLEDLAQSNKITHPGRVTVPLLGRKIHIPYAYRNGVLNYIKPEVFVDKPNTTDKAALLAIEGDQIHQNPEQSVAGPVERRLIVVSSPNSDAAVEREIGPLFEKYHVKYVPNVDAVQFADRIRREAK